MSLSGQPMKTADLLHEMLIALTGIETIFSSEDPVVPDYNKSLLEPGEADLMRRILTFGKYYGEVERYISWVNGLRLKEESKVGIYILTLGESLSQATQPYWNTLVSLEKEITQDNQCSLHFVWSRLYVHLDLLAGLVKIVNDVRMKNLRGCLILEYLQDELHSCVGVMRSAVQLIIEALNKVFYHQISCWILYGQLIDSFDEFFIRENSFTLDSHWYTPFERFSINPSMLPKFINQSAAEKILYIGQTVQFLRSNPYTTSYVTDKIEAKSDICITEGGIKGDKAKEIHRKIQEIQTVSVWNESGGMDRLVAEVFSCVTQKLWSLAVEDARLIDELRLVKEFFLLGRGELFNEFVRQIDRNFVKGLGACSGSNIDSELNSILQEAVQKILVKEDFFHRFRLEFKKSSVDEPPCNQLAGEWSNVFVQYDIPWPLQLLFTTSVLKSYNKIFQFLLRLKKIQVKLGNCWLFDKKKKGKENKRGVLHRNLWFLINNLQYYLHVDVLESQFVIFETSLKNSRGFEEIQRAHTIFLENLVGQLFISDDKKSGSASKLTINESMNKILRICEEYCQQVEIHNGQDIEESVLKTLNLRFDSCVEYLLTLLSGFSKQECYPSSQYLSQFLLRLDYNSFFTQQLSQGMFMLYL